MISFQLYDAIRVLQLQDNVSSDDNVTVELENSSLDKLEQFTLCGRFLTPYLPNMKSNIQSLIYRHSMYFMSRIELRSCEDRYSGCTRFYKDDLGIPRLLLYHDIWCRINVTLYRCEFGACVEHSNQLRANQTLYCQAQVQVQVPGQVQVRSQVRSKRSKD